MAMQALLSGGSKNSCPVSLIMLQYKKDAGSQRVEAPAHYM
jgi:hypothetical protein